eukprot:TCALIF_11912-PA protein Name:"Protein of unknown function" AED:0.20 eAED:0.20 QI:231/0.75/0.6/0.8/0.75/0.4/5/0/366
MSGPNDFFDTLEAPCVEPQGEMSSLSSSSSMAAEQMMVDPGGNASDVIGYAQDFGYSKGGRTKFSDIPVKDVVIVFFMLALWLYSIMLIVRAWAKIHVLPDSANNIGGNMWKFVMEYLQKKRKGANGSLNDTKSNPRTSISSSKREDSMIPFTEGQVPSHPDKCIIQMEETHLGAEKERKESIDSVTNGTCFPIQREDLTSFQVSIHSQEREEEDSYSHQAIYPHPVAQDPEGISIEAVSSDEANTITDKGIIINFNQDGTGCSGHPELPEPYSNPRAEPEETDTIKARELAQNPGPQTEPFCGGGHKSGSRLLKHTCSNPSFSVSKDFEISPELVERLTSHEVVNFHSNPSDNTSHNPSLPYETT